MLQKMNHHLLTNQIQAFGNAFVYFHTSEPFLFSPVHAHVGSTAILQSTSCLIRLAEIRLVFTVPLRGGGKRTNDERHLKTLFGANQICILRIGFQFTSEGLVFGSACTSIHESELFGNI